MFKLIWIAIRKISYGMSVKALLTLATIMVGLVAVCAALGGFIGWWIEVPACTWWGMTVGIVADAALLALMIWVELTERGAEGLSMWDEYKGRN